MEEGMGEAFELGEQLTVVGKHLQSGEPAPDFVLDSLDPSDSAIHRVQLTDCARPVRLVNVVISLDTPVCHVEKRRWEELRAGLPAEVRIYTVSMDLPFAQARWQAAEGVRHPTLSTHRSEQFGQDYGVLIKEWRLLQRAVFVIDQHRQNVYTQYVADQMRETHYATPLETAPPAVFR